TFFNNKQLLRHGETGNIFMPFNLQKAILIPQTASFDVLDKKYVYVVNANNQLVAKQIEVAYEMPHIYVVSKGLSATDKIVAEGLGKVKSDEKINYQFKSFKEIMLAINHIHAE
ncbi:MAG: efflux RND transporter periplasmic adaptor subunit, partial [Chitinophagaceae bacterium]